MKATLRTQKNIKLGKSYLYLDINSNGTRQKQMTGLWLYSEPKTKEEKQHNKDVMIEAESKRSEVQSNEYKFATKTCTLAELTRLYISTKKLTSSTEVTFSRMLSLVNGNIKTSSLNTDKLNSFYDMINSKDLKTSSKMLYRAKLDAVIRFGIKKSFITDGIMIHADDKLKVSAKQREYLSKEEVVMMLKDFKDKPSSRWMRIFLFSCFTGLRYSDIESLSWSNIKDNTITLETKKTSTHVVIPMNDQALALLPEGVKRGKVFSCPDNSSCRKYLLSWAKKNGIDKNISFHTARHTFATLSIQGGVDLFVVSKLLGHHNITTTQIYADLVDSKKHEAVQKLNSIFE